MSVARKLAASLASYLAIVCIGGQAQTLLPSLDPAATTSSKFLFSVDVVLDDSASPVLLGVRHGQTVAQSALEFCREQGLNGAMQTELMPQLMQILEDGIAEVVGPNVPIGDETSSPSSAVENLDPDGEGEVTNDVTLGDPVFTLGISMGGEDERTLSYYAGQDPPTVAAAFCAENLDSSSTPEALERCFNALLAYIKETLGAADSSATRETQAEQQKKQQQPPEMQMHEELENNAASLLQEPKMTVPLKINGLATELKIFRESRAEELADELCRRKEFNLEGPSMDSCLSQIVELTHRAIEAQEAPDAKEQRQQAGADPFTFKVPVTLAGLQLHAEFRTSETPRASALRFCIPNLPVIESTLGLELYDGEDGEEGKDGSQQEGIFMSEARESLKEACTVVVEDAINAVLLGLRESVMEAEMAQQANRTDSSYDDNDDNDSRWSQGDGVAGAAWATSQAVADTVV